MSRKFELLLKQRYSEIGIVPKHIRWETRHLKGGAISVVRKTKGKTYPHIWLRGTDTIASALGCLDQVEKM